MPTPAEHRALLFVAALAALGVGARGCAALRRPEPPAADRVSLARQISAVDSAITSGGRRRPAGAKPAVARSRAPAAQPPPEPAPRSPPALALSGPINMDVAPQADLDKLPGIGPALAERIVADRVIHGPFGSIEGLQRVKGVGPVLAERLRPHVTFSLPPRLKQTEVSAPGGARRP